MQLCVMWWKFVVLISVLAVAALTPACGPQMVSEEPCDFVLSSDGQRVSWAHALPVVIHLHDSVPQAALPAFEAAFDQWNQQMGREMFQLGGWVSGAATPTGDRTNVIYWASNWEPNRETEQARTTLRWTGKKIVDADMKINGVYMNNYGVNISTATPSPYQLDLVSLVVHELGHVLGRGHGKSEINDLTDHEYSALVATLEPSVMHAKLRQGVVRRTLSDYDRQMMACEY